MATPTRAADKPYAADVQEGKTYFWCACGNSAKQPFCDGAHAGSGFTPVKFRAEKSAKVFFCGCKATANQPLCDGSHNT